MTFEEFDKELKVLLSRLAQSNTSVENIDIRWILPLGCPPHLVNVEYNGVRNDNGQ